MSYQGDLRDIRFVLFDLLQLGDLLGKPPFAELDRETIEQMLVGAEKFARERLAPLNAVGDRQGCSFHEGRVTVPPGFKEAHRAFCDLGFLSANAPAAEGGMGLPQAVGLALDELFVSANCAYSNYPALTRAGTNMLRQWGSPEQKERYLPGLLSGRWQGTMCLTEAGAGSFVGATRCVARPVPDGGEGCWLLAGEKIFISAVNLDMAENVIHFVLARTPGAPPGIRGLSLFLVPHLELDGQGEPAGGNDVKIAGTEEKMGIHGTVTTTLLFGEDGHCAAELVGPQHEGIKLMFQMMNEERVQVGVQGQAVSAAAYHEALLYARERVQGIPLTSKSRDPKDQVAIIEHPDVRRMLLKMKGYVEGSRALLLRCGLHIDQARLAGDPAQQAYHHGWIELLTPICKAYCSDVGFEVTVLAMQVFGGMGYIRETGVEQLMRDSRITSVYEGTNGIQALDLLFRKVPQGKGALVQAWDGELRAFVDEHGEHPRLAAEVALLDQARRRAGEVIARLTWRMARGELDAAALHATPFLHLAGNLMLAWLLLQEAVLAERQLLQLALPEEPAARKQRLAEDPAAAHLAAKLPTARFFVHHVLAANEGLARSMLGEDCSALEVVF